MSKLVNSKGQVFKNINDWLVDDWKSLQCKPCRDGSRHKCKCTKKNARAYRVDHKGKYHYYCFLGCLMLQLTQKERDSFALRQYNVDGHYEKLKREFK